jgi:hypothetical protein
VDDQSHTQISLEKWRKLWFEDRACAPWYVYVSNLPVKERIEADKLGFEGRGDPRGDCGSIKLPLRSGNPLIVRMYPVPERRHGTEMELPLCLVNEELTDSTSMRLHNALVGIRASYKLDLVDSLCLVVYTLQWQMDRLRAERGTDSVFSRRTMKLDGFSLEDQVDWLLAENTSKITVEQLLDFWNTIGISLADGYLRPAQTSTQVWTYTQIPLRQLSAAELKAIYGVTRSRHQVTSTSTN